MINRSSSIKNLWLFKNSHLNALLVDGFVSKRGKATALNLADNLDESTNGNGVNGKKNSKASPAINGSANSSSSSSNNDNTPTDISDNNNSASSSATNLTEAKQQTFYNKNVWLDDRSKYGHTGKELQDKIAAERRLRAEPLLNLVFANRKLSFYDTSHTPGRDDGIRRATQTRQQAKCTNEYELKTKENTRTIT
ncbi:probable DNA replication complex GINS protein PSF3 [Rhagoletis pomonella]|uniref:probable DNA replication complex GINS protein PSF3 n=1 Tax=Rhagoletis pomonella TaxID=28610 RepID=UPI001786CFBF|nr:probable DNA replication complex GINS protein PSF3 [Rhagoletis pomonella]